MTEKTLKTYLEQSIRIQLVMIITDETKNKVIDDNKITVKKILYEVRKNRKIQLKTEYYEAACNSFLSMVNYHINQLSLF